MNQLNIDVNKQSQHKTREKRAPKTHVSLPRKSIWPITKGTGSPVNQSKLKENASSGREARENTCKKVKIGFGFTSDWMKTWREVFEPIV